MRTRLLALASLFAGAAFATLLGCGVGITGTGTGETATPEDFGGTSASVCLAPFAELICGPDVVISPGTPATTKASFVDVSTSRQVLAVFENNGMTFDAICPGLRFVGSWGVDATGSGRFYGVASRAGGRQLATLDVGVVSNGVLAFTLKDKDGSVIFGPRELKAAVAPTLDPSTCP